MDETQQIKARWSAPADGFTCDDYQRQALRTARSPLHLTEREVLSNWTLGIAGEAGEFADRVKKVLFHGGPRFEIDAATRHQLAAELGDLLWYVAVLADALGLRLGDVAAGNVAKLAARYPQGFAAGGGHR
jgi:NTP pyrophosphatase (non-canonical NTP hydrolase)